MIKLKLTYEVIYEVDPSQYTEKNAGEIAFIEQEILKEDKAEIISIEGKSTLTVTPVI